MNLEIIYLELRQKLFEIFFSCYFFMTKRENIKFTIKLPSESKTRFVQFTRLKIFNVTVGDTLKTRLKVTKKGSGNQ